MTFPFSPGHEIFPAPASVETVETKDSSESCAETGLQVLSRPGFPREKSPRPWPLEGVRRGFEL